DWSSDVCSSDLNVAIIAEITSAPAAGPNAAPAPKIAFANPRSDAGNHSRMIRFDAGQLVDSPIPITTRVPIMKRKLGANPVRIVATDQRNIPRPSTTFPPTRSTSNPTGTRQTTY